LRKTDYDLQTIPRAIYNDFIAEMQLREEGYSGSNKPNLIIQQQPIRFESFSDNLAFLSRAPPVDLDKEHEIEVAQSSPIIGETQENVETRTVMITDWGIDILNPKPKNPIVALEKPNIASPLEKPVYTKYPRSLQCEFLTNVRYGSWLNHANAGTKQFHDQARKSGIQIEKQKVAVAKKSNLRYKKVFIALPPTIPIRGLSFRGRGQLDMRMGWANPSEFDETLLGGDIVDNMHQNEFDIPISLTDDLDQIAKKPMSVRKSLKHISSVISATEVTFINRRSEVVEPWQSNPIKVLQKGPQSLKIESEINSESHTKIIMEEECVVESPKVRISQPIDKSSPKRNSLPSAIQDEAKDIIQNTRYFFTQEHEQELVDSSKMESQIVSADSSTENGNISKRHSELGIEQSKENETQEEEDTWIRQEKLNLFGNWRSNTPDRLEGETIGERTRLGITPTAKKITIADEEKEQKPISRLEMISQRAQEAVQFQEKLAYPEQVVLNDPAAIPIKPVLPQTPSLEVPKDLSLNSGLEMISQQSPSVQQNLDITEQIAKPQELALLPTKPFSLQNPSLCEPKQEKPSSRLEMIPQRSKEVALGKEKTETESFLPVLQSPVLFPTNTLAVEAPKEQNITSRLIISSHIYLEEGLSHEIQLEDKKSTILHTITQTNPEASHVTIKVIQQDPPGSFSSTVTAGRGEKGQGYEDHSTVVGASKDSPISLIQTPTSPANKESVHNSVSSSPCIKESSKIIMESPEECCNKPHTVIWKEHKVEIRLIDFEIHGIEIGKSKFN
jgi:hypothetical protein